MGKSPQFLLDSEKKEQMGKGRHEENINTKMLTAQRKRTLAQEEPFVIWLQITHCAGRRSQPRMEKTLSIFLDSSRKSESLRN